MPAASRGITLIELLTGLAIVAILVSLGAPGLQRSVERAASETVVTELARMIASGRAAAVTHDSMLSLCSLDTNASPAPRCRKGAWLGPLTLFTDHNADSVLNGSDSIVWQQLLPKVPGSLLFRAFPNSRTALQFNNLGFTNNQSGNFLWCAGSGDAATAHQLIFSNTGRTRLTRDSNADGVREGANGKNLVCP